MGTFLITGGTGFIGREIVRRIVARGHEARVITRNREWAERRLPPEAIFVAGDPVYKGEWQHAVAGCEVLIALAGEPVAGQRWDVRFKQKLHDSRVDSLRNVVEAVRVLPSSERPRSLISASGVDFYPWALDLGPQNSIGADDEIDERVTHGDSFLAQVCRSWEEEAFLAQELGLRVVAMRTGLVLGSGGPLDKMARQFKFFVGGPLGTGRQWVSWIHLADVAQAYLFAAQSSALSGPVNLVAPEPVKNREFGTAIGRAMKRPSWLPAPGFALKLVLGEFADYVLNGRRCVPRALLAAGYQFEHPSAHKAVSAALS